MTGNKGKFKYLSKIPIHHHVNVSMTTRKINTEKNTKKSQKLIKLIIKLINL